MGASAPLPSIQELLYPPICIPQSVYPWLFMSIQLVTKRVGECKTKTPSIKKGFSVSLAESIRFELMHPNYWMTD